MPDEHPSNGFPHGPRRLGAVRGAVAAVAVAAAVLPAASCGQGPDGDGSSGARSAPREDRLLRPPSHPSSPGASPSASLDSDWDTAPDSLAALGDSITRAFNACSPLADCPGASWATGTSPGADSLARRLLPDPPGASRNHARSGALMADLPAQMERAAAHRPELVTVLIGANDACRPTAAAMTPVADFRADFAEALRVLRRTSPRSQVYVVSIPDLERLWSVGRSEPRALRAWRLGVCPSMLADPTAEDAAAVERRGRVAARVRAYNAALAEVCERDERCRHDGGAVHGHRFAARDLSPWDWFHPGARGQRKLAEIAHRDVTAARPPS